MLYEAERCHVGQHIIHHEVYDRYGRRDLTQLDKDQIRLIMACQDISHLYCALEAWRRDVRPERIWRQSLHRAAISRGPLRHDTSGRTRWILLDERYPNTPIRTPGHWEGSIIHKTSTRKRLPLDEKSAVWQCYISSPPSDQYREAYMHEHYHSKRKLIGPQVSYVVLVMR
jgi:hypothetical protein